MYEYVPKYCSFPNIHQGIIYANTSCADILL